MFEISRVFKIIYIEKKVRIGDQLQDKQGIRDKPYLRYRYFTVLANDRQILALELLPVT
jgi:hypothetical protein